MSRWRTVSGSKKLCKNYIGREALHVMLFKVLNIYTGARKLEMEK